MSIRLYMREHEAREEVKTRPVGSAFVRRGGYHEKRSAYMANGVACLKS
jgi:hypothetical protein